MQRRDGRRPTKRCHDRDRRDVRQLQAPLVVPAWPFHEGIASATATTPSKSSTSNTDDQPRDDMDLFENRARRPPPSQSRSCCSRASSTGSANGDTPTPTRSTNDSSAESRARPATPTGSSTRITAVVRERGRHGPGVGDARGVLDRFASSGCRQNGERSTLKASSQWLVRYSSSTKSSKPVTSAARSPSSAQNAWRALSSGVTARVTFAARAPSVASSRTRIAHRARSPPAELRRRHTGR